jgi:hypothetical protein
MVVGMFSNETSGAALAAKINLRSSEEWALKRYLTIDDLEAVRKSQPTTFGTSTKSLTCALENARDEHYPVELLN